MEETEEKCWIFGDESGQIDSGRFFAIGVLGTKEPQAVISKLKELRARAGYADEVSYKLGNNKMALCAIKWMDWFFGSRILLNSK